MDYASFPYTKGGEQAETAPFCLVGVLAVFYASVLLGLPRKLQKTVRSARLPGISAKIAAPATLCKMTRTGGLGKKQVPQVGPADGTELSHSPALHKMREPSDR